MQALHEEASMGLDQGLAWVEWETLARVSVGLLHG